MIKIGITGILGSGKTTVSNLLRRAGYSVIDLDSLAKEVIEREDVRKEIGDSLGAGFLRDGRVDVEKLREAAFREKELLKGLEEIIHPRVRAELFERIGLQREAGAVVVDAPLLIERGLHRSLDRIVVVSAERNNILGRLKLRGMTDDDVERRLQFQISLAEKEKMADHVVRNDGTRGDLEREVEVLLQKMKQWEVEVNAPK
jgi:dephospho-CoA kinase